MMERRPWQMGDSMPRLSPRHQRPIVVLSLPLARRPSHTRSRPLSDGLHDEVSPLRRGLCQRHWDQHQDRPTDGPRRAHAR